MAEVTKYGSNFPDGTLPQNPIDSFTRIHAVQGTVEIANGDSADSVVYICRVPSHFRPLKGISLIHSDGITSLDDLDFGDVNDPDGLADGLDVSGAGSDSLFAALNIDELDNPLWQILGYASEQAAPPVVDLYLTLNATTTGAGTLSWELFFLKP